MLSYAQHDATPKSKTQCGGMLNGNLNIKDIRAKAKAAADQRRALTSEGGDETGFATDGYVAILHHSLKETAPSGPTINTPTSAPNPKPEVGME